MWIELNRHVRQGSLLLIALTIAIIAISRFFHREATALSKGRTVDFKSLALALSQIDVENGIRQSDGIWSWRLKLATIQLPIPKTFHPDWKQSWDSPRNRQFETNGYPLFCRKDQSAYALGIVGLNTGLDLGFCDGGFYSEDLILVVETADNETHWMEPKEFVLAELDFGKGRRPGSEVADGFHVVFADGAVWRLRRDTPLPLLCGFLTVDRVLAHSRDELSGYALEMYEGANTRKKNGQGVQIKAVRTH